MGGVILKQRSGEMQVLATIAGGMGRRALLGPQTGRNKIKNKMGWKEMSWFPTAKPGQDNGSGRGLAWLAVCGGGR